MNEETQKKISLAIAELRIALSKVEGLGGEDTQIEVDVIRGNIEELEDQVKFVVAGKPEEEEVGVE